MAKAKVTATKSAKQATKKNARGGAASGAKKSATKAKPAENSAGATKSPRKTAPPTKQLTSETRRKLLKPRDNYDELVERVARTWETAKAMRVPGLSVARLRKLLKDAKRAKDKEQAMREKLERALRPLGDNRLLAEDQAWRAVLDVNAAVKLYARNDPALAETFAFLTDALTSNGSDGG